ncbi:hypothetical protein [uncultured Roseivirga sp.]|uniref:hypothetical protein n=1 Tax=uncultured Roseivirga sp. TaxID=543088 RepID=UPI0030D78398|tara:strand:+ start:89146 stop:90648 length:1503 start_codon:yes stop_codon:yes gene_type:complete
MALQKGFLKASKFELNRHLLFTWFIYLLAISVSLYFVFVYVGEIILITTTHPLFALPIEDSEIRFYSLFLAGLSVVAGFGLSSQLVLRTSERSTNRSVKFNHRLIQNVIGFNTWSTLSIISRVFGVYALIGTTLHLGYFLRLDGGHQFVFYGILVVIFLNNWLESHRLLKQNYFKYLGWSALIVTLLTFTLAKVFPLNHGLLNEYIKKHSIYTQYNFDLPEVKSYQRLRSEYRTPRFFITHSSELGLPKILSYTRGGLFETPHGSLANYIEKVNPYSSNELELFIDKKVSLTQVMSIKTLIDKQLNHPKISVRVSGLDDELPEPATILYNRAITGIFPSQTDCSAEKKFLSSLVKEQIKPTQVRWPEANSCYAVANYAKYNRILLEVSEDQLKLNGTIISKALLRETVISLFQKYEDKALVFIKPNTDISFGSYLSAIDEVRSAIIELRVASGLLDHGIEYDFFNASVDYEENRSVENKYPLNIMILTGWNLELYEYLKK